MSRIGPGHHPYALASLAVAVPVLVTILGGGERVEVLALAQLAVLGLLGWSVWRMVSHGKVVIRRTGFELPLLLLLLAALISTLLSGNRYSSTLGTFELGAYIAFFLIAANWLASVPQIRLMSIVIVVLGVAESFLAFSQRFGQGIERVMGSLPYSNYFTDLLLVGVSISFAYLLFGRRSLAPYLAAGAASAVLLGTLVMTGTRAAIVALIVVASLLGALRGRGWLLICLIALVVLFVAVPNSITERLLNVGEYDIYAYKRLDIWQQSLRTFTTAPLFGVGPRNYAAAARQFSFPVDGAVGRYAHSAQIAHNEFMHVGVELGVVGFALFTWVIVLFLGVMRRVRRLEVDPATTPFVVGSTAGVMALLVHALFDNVLYLPGNALIFFLLLGALAGLMSGSRYWRWEFQPSRVRTLYVAIALLLVAQGIVRPAIATVLSGRAGEALRKGSHDRAIAALERARLVAPGDANLAGALGGLYELSFIETRRAADIWSSFIMYEKAILADRLEPRYETALADMLVRRCGFADPETADAILGHRERAVGLDPHNPFLRLDLAEAHVERGELRQAVAAVQSALALEPNFPGAHIRLAQLYEEQGEPSLALEHYHQALAVPIGELRPHAMNGYELRLLEYDRGTVERSVDRLALDAAGTRRISR
ncbi:hypothetical protein AMJ82_04335 [candidate division TA06 bacterium SM23_40]|uniref:O-antigen ligase-related domain-containing protein n=1 Tax=candidate division TA06 bacterium SM23_40 TaxID=1703774 RepID=A0A0S8GAX4_UNCT6|nr:MAG: hypothetical protein AMJ82_04335 [candidate division TA06 bacterium SM23_40]